MAGGSEQLNLDNFKKALEAYGEAFVSELSKSIRSRNMIATGSLLRSLDYEIIEDLGKYVVRLKSEDYLNFLDVGRSPGKFPPVKEIQKWVEAKGIRYKDSTNQQTAYVIARSIANKGIQPTDILNNTIRTILDTRGLILTEAITADILENMVRPFVDIGSNI